MHNALLPQDRELRPNVLLGNDIHLFQHSINDELLILLVNVVELLLFAVLEPGVPWFGPSWASD